MFFCLGGAALGGNRESAEKGIGSDRSRKNTVVVRTVEQYIESMQDL